MRNFRLPESLTTPDDQDVQLACATRELQEAVEHFARRQIIPVDRMDIAQQQAWVEAVKPHLQFELDQSKDIWPAQPVVFTGIGAIIVFDAEGTPRGIQPTGVSDSIVGVIDEVSAYPVPPISVIVDSHMNDTDTPLDELSPSALVMLDSAHFIERNAAGGTTVHDLGHLRVAIPLVYGMKVRMLDYQV